MKPYCLLFCVSLLACASSDSHFDASLDAGAAPDSAPDGAIGTDASAVFDAAADSGELDAALDVGSDAPALPDVGPPVSDFTLRLLPGSDELVLRQQPCRISDSPFQMWKDAQGRANAIISVPHNYAVRSTVAGGELVISPDATGALVYTSPQQQVASLYNSKMWLTSFWTDNGRDVYALAHHEWYPAPLYRRYTGDPSTLCGEGGTTMDGGRHLDAWVNAVHHLRSRDGGRTFETTVAVDPSASSNARRAVLVPEPFGDKPVSPAGVARYGFFSPSNIVREADHYYFTVAVQEVLEDGAGNPTAPRRQGLMLVRTSDITQPRSGSTYEMWRGDRWVPINSFLPIGGPFIFTHQAGLASSEVLAGAQATLHSMSYSLKWSSEHQQWVILGYSRVREISYILTPSLAEPALGDVRVVQDSRGNGPQTDGGWFASYPTLIDHTSAGFVFQELNDAVYLYYVAGQGGGVRHVRRMRVLLE